MEGILPLWKPRGMTSHDCVFKLRKILQMKKIGHSGTLDPDVDGVLPICVGQATKVVEYLQDGRKIYHGEVTLGLSTTTEDSSGDVVERKRVTEPPTAQMIDDVMASFEGEITQIPPMYSAVKVGGKRLYQYARQGITVERPKRQAIIYSFQRTGEPVYNEEEGTFSWTFTVECGKGTYVRTLAVDTGAKLGYPAHMSDLTRIASGGFSKEETLSLEEVEVLMAENKLSDKLLPIERVFEAFASVELTDEQFARVKNGAVLPEGFFDIDTLAEPYALYYQRRIIALYHAHPTKKGFLKPLKMLRNV